MCGQHDRTARGNAHDRRDRLFERRNQLQMPSSLMLGGHNVLLLVRLAAPTIATYGSCVCTVQWQASATALQLSASLCISSLTTGQRRNIMPMSTAIWRGVQRNYSYDRQLQLYDRYVQP